LDKVDLRGIDWVIVGGESGPGARPMLPEWVRDIRDQCHKAGVASMALILFSDVKQSNPAR
jgi:protein gp37